MGSEALLGRIGVIADVQYVNQEDGFDFSGVQRRRYRNSIEVLQRAVKHWNSIGKVTLVAQLGDLLDVKNTTSNEKGKRDGSTSLEALSKVQSVLGESTCEDFVNIIGNHELYNFSRSKLDELLDVKRGGLETWHSFLPVTGSKLRVVVLDPYQVSTIEGATEDNTKSAFDYLCKHNPNDITKMGVNWSKGLEGLDRRFMPYNGMIAQDQLAWLDKTLGDASCSGEKVIILALCALYCLAMTTKVAACSELVSGTSQCRAPFWWTVTGIAGRRSTCSRTELSGLGVGRECLIISRY